MAYTYFVDDPAIGPTHAEKTGDTSLIQLRSMGYRKNDDAPSFIVIFENALEGFYDVAASTAAVGGSKLGATTFMSEPIAGGQFQEVKIILKQKTQRGSTVPHPEEGYKYTIVMNGKALDPRVIPR